MRYNTNQININFPDQMISTSELSAGEFFAGGGGWTEGMHNVPGVRTKWILNHDAVALKINAEKHPEVKVYWSDIYVQDEHELEYVDYIHASIECTQHSKANGGREKKLGSYTMAWELYRYFKHLLPLVLSIENVPEFKKWSPTDGNGKPIKERMGEEFERWKKAMMYLGYEYQESIRVAADDGLPTTRKRYFSYFYRPGCEISFPETTHSESGQNGKEKWVSCKQFIDIEDEGESIFGREFNENLPKHVRRPLKPNSLRRIASGIKIHNPELMQFIVHYYNSNGSKHSQKLTDPLATIMTQNKHQLVSVEPEKFITTYYGSTSEQEFRGQSLDKPLATITTANRHQLVRAEKIKFIADHCHVDTFQPLEEPLKTILTWQTKTKVTVDNFITQYYGTDQSQSIEAPLNTCTTKDRHQLIRIEKFQFLTKYFNSNGKPGYNTESLDKPLSVVMTDLKHQLITVLDNFDVKARFLKSNELARCSTFPEGYFDGVSHKNAVKLIGNAVPPMWAEKLTKHNLQAIVNFKQTLKKNSNGKRI